MKQQANVLTVATPDLDAARRFYVDGLGWTPTLDVPDEILFLQIAPGLLLGLFEAESFSTDVGGRVPAAVSGVTVAHNLGDRQAVHDLVGEMVAAGGTVLKEPQDGDFGGIFHAQVQDPNGLVWEIAHNPGWSVADDGTVHLA